MPEIGEVARVVNALRKHLAGKVISNVKVIEDTMIFAGTTANEFKKAMTGKKVVDAKQWGKYFWLVMDSPPHPVMHLGMAAWVHIKQDPRAHYQPMKSKSLKKPDKNSKSKDDEVEWKQEQTEWPPRYWKFNLELEDDNNEIAFTDGRRWGRIRLVDEKDGNNIRNVPPISANGPDPVQEPVTLEWLQSKLKGKKVKVKAFLLDQAMLSGVGNWVGDEILYDAKLHPETYTNTLSAQEIERLHQSVLRVTKIAVETEGEQDLFPEQWIMKYRWNKGKYNQPGEAKLPNGEKIEFVIVDGRSSAYVPSVQKKKDGKEVENVTERPQRGMKRNAAREETDEESEGKKRKTVASKKRKQETQTQQDGKKKRALRGDIDEESEGKEKRTQASKKGKQAVERQQEAKKRAVEKSKKDKKKASASPSEKEATPPARRATLATKKFSWL